MSNSIQLETSLLKPMPLKKKEREPKQDDDRSSSSSTSIVVASAGHHPLLVIKSGHNQVDGDEDEDGDGYHTPTSPPRIIQAPVECPPAPRKPPPRRYKKRKACCCLIEIKDIELVFSSKSVDHEGKRSKKARF